MSSLKQHLCRLCGYPRFRQRLLHDDDILEDDTTLDAPMDLELVLLPYIHPSEEEVKELLRASALGHCCVMAEILHRPQDPNFSLPGRSSALAHACAGGQEEAVCLLLDAGAELAEGLRVAASESQCSTVRLLLNATNDDRDHHPMSWFRVADCVLRPAIWRLLPWCCGVGLLLGKSATISLKLASALCFLGGAWLFQVATLLASKASARAARRRILSRDGPLRISQSAQLCYLFVNYTFRHMWCSLKELTDAFGTQARSNIVHGTSCSPKHGMLFVACKP